MRCHLVCNTRMTALPKERGYHLAGLKLLLELSCSVLLLLQLPLALHLLLTQLVLQLARPLLALLLLHIAFIKPRIPSLLITLCCCKTER